MTKIKNAKKGMAKKTLSMSLVVAMLATSNVPVWAAEFSDGTDAAFTSEVEAPVVEDNTADATEAQTAGDAWTVKLDKDLPTSVAWGNTDNVTGTIKQAGVDATSVSGLKYTWKDVATGLATDAGTDLTVGTDGKFTISLPTAKECVGNSYALFMWDNNGDWKYTSSAVSVVAKNIKDAGATVALKAGAEIGYTGKEVKAAVNVTMPSDFETTGKYSVDYTGAPDLINKGSKVTVTVTVTDSKLYTGSVTTEYTIGQKAATAEDFKLTYINNSYEYTGSAIAPAKADIRVQDVNGKTIDGAVKSVTPTITATEVGSYEANAEVDLSKFENYSGILTTKVDGKYNVVARDLSKCIVTVKAKSASVDNKAVAVTASDLTIKDAKGNVLPLTDNDITVTVPSNAVASGTYTVTIGPKSGTKNVTGSTTATLTLYAKDINDVVDTTTNLTSLDKDAKDELNKTAYYTGSQITKDASKFVGHILKKGTTDYLDKNQYSVEFDTNVDAGTGYVLIVGKNTYAGSVAKIPFTIQKATVDEKDIKVANVEYKEGDGKDYKPAVTITAKTADKKSWTLKEGTDYTVKYALVDTNEIDKTVKATITFSDNVKKNYDLPTTADYYGTIVGKTLTSANIKMEKTSYDYTGKAIVPEYKVYDGDKLLKEGTDYVVKNTIGGKDVGEATLVITGKGNYNSKIDATAKFTVAPISADKVTVTYKNAEYNGSAIQPKLDAIEVKLGNVDVKSQFKITGYGENINAGKEAGSLTLTPVKDNKNFTAGTTKNATFDIAQANLTGTIKVYNANGIQLTGTQKFTYDGTEKTFAKVVFTPSVTGNMKVTSDDYEIQYVNNTTGAGGAKVIVVAKGNYKATNTVKDLSTGKEVEVKNVAASEDFTIESKLYFTEKEVTVTDAEYAGPNMIAEPTIVVRDGDKVLVKDKDYEVTLYPLSAGTAPSETSYTWIVKGKGVYADTSKGNYAYGTWKIVKKNVANLDVKVDLNAKGETVLTVMNGNLKVDNKDFDVKLSDDKKTATVSATTGNQYYVGSKEVTVGGEAAKVGAPVISSVKVVGNKATVILSGEADGATGYDYVISKANDTTTARVDVTKNQVKTTGDFNYVQQGTYYAYCHAWRRNAEGKKVFGEWSNIYPFSVSAITPAQPVITSVKAKGTTVTVTYTKAANAEGYDVVLGSAAKKVNGEYRPVSYGKLVKKNIKGNVVTATFKNVKKGTYYAGLHAFNKTSEDGKKVFSQWSNVKKVTVK